MRKSLSTIAVIVFLISCENRALHDSEEFKPREIHERIEFHFDKVEVDGIEYLILEKDNNNPHEGFGFMAFRANKMMEKQDSIIAYLKTMMEVQSAIYARTYNVDQQTAENYTEQILNKNLDEQLREIRLLEQSKLSGRTGDTTDIQPDQNQ